MFQSHAGSIEARSPDCLCQLHSRFQSHAGSIEAGRPLLSPLLRPARFNPTLVRLRHVHTSASDGLLPGFNPTLVRLRREKGSQAFYDACQSFNPTLVRLRPSLPDWVKAVMESFNPTLVRLRPKSDRRDETRRTGFQSHAGSIEALRVGGLRVVTLSCFNPTLVRLRLRWRAAWGGENGGFNPTLVRLRPPRGSWNTGPPPCFNPTLVRLRRFRSRGGYPMKSSFNPTLVRLRLPSRGHRSTTCPRVSIPRWFD